MAHFARNDKNLPIVFGLEKLGLLALRFPLVTIVCAFVLAIAAVAGVRMIRIDDSLGQLFRSDSAEYAQFVRISRDFPSNEYDVLVVVEGSSLLQRDSIDKLRSLVTDLQLVDGTRGVISLFSARQPSTSGGIPAPVFPEVLPEGPAYDKLVDAVRANDIIRGKLLSDDGTLALAVLSLDPAVVEGDKLGAVVSDIRRVAAEDMSDAGLIVQLSGVPVMQLEVRKALERDRVVYNALGFLFGCVIAIFFFRRLSLMIVAAGPPLLAIVLGLGVLGALGFKLNVFLNAMTPLIMVIAFSDSMQLTFAARDQMMKGADKRTAFADAVRVVGPACVLTHATAAVSFASLLLSSSDAIRGFGEAGLLATAVALFTVLSLVPVLGLLLTGAKSNATMPRADTGVNALRWFCDWIAARMVRRPGVYSLIGLCVVALLAVVYLGLQPQYRLADQVPDREQAVHASGRLDAKLTGSNPIDVLVELPKRAELFSPETMQVIAEVQQTLETQPGVGNVWSLDSLHRWLSEKLGKPDIATLKEYLDLLPSSLVQRFVAADKKSVVVAGFVPDKQSDQLLPIVDQLNVKLRAVADRHPGFAITPTGLAVIAARNSAAMIGKLNRGLTLEFVFIALFVGLAFRSLVVIPATLLTGVFPVLAAGALLRALGDGLQFSSVVALTVSFGLGLSATVHFLNRMHRELTPGEDPAVAVMRATVLVGPALILTSIVLACGLAALGFSQLPMLRTFGWLSAFTMLAALAADLLILRPTITFLARLRGARAPSRSSPSLEGSQNARP